MPNITWEDMGITIGIMVYIMKNYAKLIEKTIVLPIGRIRYIMKTLFYKIRFSKRKSINNFIINIKNNVNSGLVINNINNLYAIRGEKVKLLPWYDKDNPLIMFIANEERTIDKKVILKKIKAIDSNRKYSLRRYPNIVEQRCKIQTWDTNLTNNVLAKYVRRYTERKYTPQIVYDFISNVLCNTCCYKEVQMLYPIKIPYVVNKYEDNGHKENNDELLDVINSKIKETNKLLELL